MKGNPGFDYDAVSEIVGAILLIAMTVLAASVVGVYIFSQPQAEPVDRAEILISANTTTVFFQNMGGDSLSESNLALYYNGVNVSFDGSSSWPFMPGGNVTYTPPLPPPTTNLSDSVYLVYTGLSSEGVLLDILVEENQVDRSSWAVTVPGPIPTSTSGGGPPEPPTPAEAGELIWNYTNFNSTQFSQLGNFKNCIVAGKHYNFTVDSVDNWVRYVGGNVPLSTGDTVSIVTANCDWMSYYAVGKTGIEISFDDVYLYKNGVSVEVKPNGDPTSIQIVSSKISEYSNIDSTLTVDTSLSTGDGWVTFWQNGTLILNSVFTTNYVFSNFMPTDTGLMLIDLRTSNPQRFYMLAYCDVSPPV